MGDSIVDLIVMDESGKITTTSPIVARAFGKEHRNVLRDIDNLDCSEAFRTLNFELSSYKPAGAKRSYPMFHITRDGFVFLVTGFTGQRAAAWKEKFIAAFNAMEDELRKSMTPAFKLPANFVEALRELANVEERRQAAERAKSELLTEVDALMPKAAGATTKPWNLLPIVASA